MEKIGLKPIHVRYKGVFDFEGLYKLIYQWLHERGYRSQEDKYKNKPSSPWGYEHEVKISAEKKVDGYYKYIFKIVMHARDAAEIEHNGMRLLNGRIQITINATIITDYSKKFEGSKFKEFLGKLYSVITKREMEFKHWDPLYYRMHGLQEDIKKHLNMYADTNY